MGGQEVLQISDYRENRSKEKEKKEVGESSGRKK